MALPTIEITNLADLIDRKNWERLRDFLKKESPLLGFRHFELTFTKTQTNLRVAHSLGILPRDVLTTSILGAGTVTFNYNLFTSTEIDLTIAGTVTSANPTIIRFFLGTYSGDPV